MKKAQEIGSGFETTMAQAADAARVHGKPATVGRHWLSPRRYQWAIRFDAVPVTFDDGTRFEPVATA